MWHVIVALIPAAHRRPTAARRSLILFLSGVLSLCTWLDYFFALIYLMNERRGPTTCPENTPQTHWCAPFKNHPRLYEPPAADI